MKQSLCDIALVEGNNELNVQMAPLGVVTPWSFSNVQCSIVPSGIGAWPMVSFSALVTNIGDKQVTKTITQYRRDYIPVYNPETGGFDWQWGDWAIATTNEGTVLQYEVTLAPGASYQYNSPPPGEHTLITADPGTKAECYLADSDGYESAHCAASV
ncbi:hypothetical protein ES703_37504 [subsurface metagenome]